jgi:hypothetical protein
MADADRIHENLPKRYRKAYQQICEWNWDKESISYEVLRPLKRDISDQGNGPILLIRNVSQRLEEICSSPLFINSIDWAEEFSHLSNLRMRIPGNKRGMELAVLACREIIQEIRAGRYSYSNLDERLISSYFLRIYYSNFEDRIPLVSEHYLGVEPEEIEQRINSIRPIVEKGVEYFAAQALNGRDIKKLRLPPNPLKKQSIQLDDDVLKL